MSDDYLNYTDRSIVESVLGTDKPDGFWRFWSWDELQLDGEFTLSDLERFTDAMRKMAQQHNGTKP